MLEFITAIIGLIFAWVLLPVFIGFLWLLFFGLPVYLLMKLWDVIVDYILNPMFGAINGVPFFGRIVTFFLSGIIGAVAICAVIGFVQIPMLMLIYRSFI